jgi:hypothetical protein
MSRVLLIVGCFLSLCASVTAQTTTPPVAPSPGPACRIALPYTPEQISDCGPRAAAAYDFAFCSLSYLMFHAAAPPSDKALGEGSQSESFRRAGIAYARISEAFSDAGTFQRNTALAKKYYESLQGQANLFEPAIKYVRSKCTNVEGWHSEVLQQLIQELKSRRVEKQ